jgi:hypothetical protein
MLDIWDAWPSCPKVQINIFYIIKNNTRVANVAHVTEKVQNPEFVCISHIYLVFPVAVAFRMNNNCISINSIISSNHINKEGYIIPYNDPMTANDNKLPLEGTTTSISALTTLIKNGSLSHLIKMTFFRASL